MNEIRLDCFRPKPPIRWCAIFHRCFLPICLVFSVKFPAIRSVLAASSAVSIDECVQRAGFQGFVSSQWALGGVACGCRCFLSLLSAPGAFLETFSHFRGCSIYVRLFTVSPWAFRVPWAVFWTAWGRFPHLRSPPFRLHFMLCSAGALCSLCAAVFVWR